MFIWALILKQNVVLDQETYVKYRLDDIHKICRQVSSKVVSIICGSSNIFVGVNQWKVDLLRCDLNRINA